MKQARHITADGHAKPVEAAHYNAAVHGSNLLCGDPACPAKVDIVPTYSYHGGSVEVPTHFRSVHRADHRPGCLCVGKDEPRPESDDHETFAAAVKSGRLILMDLNFNMSLPGFGQFKSLQAALKANTHYHQFCNEHLPFHVGAKNANDVFARMTQIENTAPEQMAGLYVGHGTGRPQLFDQFDIRGGKKQKPVKRLFNNMRAQAFAHRGYSFVVASAPHLHKITDKTREVTLKTKDQARLVLRHEFEFSSPALEQAFNAYDRVHLIGSFSVETSNIQRAEAVFEEAIQKGESGKGVCRAVWNISNPAQFRPTKNAQMLMVPDEANVLHIPEAVR